MIMKGRYYVMKNTSAITPGLIFVVEVCTTHGVLTYGI